MSFIFKSETKKGVHIFYLEGELIERFQAKELMESADELISLNQVKIILDVKDLKYLNSSGLSILVNLFTKCRNAGGELIIAELSPKVKELLIVSKLNTIFTVKNSLKEALEYITELAGAH